MERGLVVYSMTSRKKGSRKDERESIPQVFQQLHSASRQCLQASHSGAHTGQSDAFKPAESSVQMIWFGKQIKQQLTDMKSDLQLRGTTKETIDGSLNVSLKMANMPLEKQVCSVRNKELAIVRMQYSYALLNDLQKGAQSRPVKELMNHSLVICKKIQSVQLSNMQLEDELMKIRKSRMEMRIRQQELFRQVKLLEEKNNTLQHVEMRTQTVGRETMESTLNKVITIQEIFQRFILSAHVHWAEDPHLKQLLVKMKNSPWA